MSSWLFEWFMKWKVDVAMDECRRNGRSRLSLTNHEIQELSDKLIKNLYDSRIIHLLLNKNSIKNLPRDFGFYAQKLVSLSLASNNFSEIPTSIGLLQALKFINISHNPLSSDELPVTLCELKKLETLHANNTNVKVIPEDFYELTELKVLALRQNRFSSVPSLLLKLPQLQRLSLANNLINEVPLQIVEAKALVHLNLSSNSISYIPSTIWKNMKSLQYVFLTSNRLVVTSAFVKQIQEMPKLRKVYLSHNIMNFAQTSPFCPEKFIVTPGTMLTPEIDVDELWKRESSLWAETSESGLLPPESSINSWNGNNINTQKSFQALNQNSKDPDLSKGSRIRTSMSLPYGSGFNAMFERSSNSYIWGVDGNSFHSLPDGIAIKTKLDFLGKESFEESSSETESSGGSSSQEGTSFSQENKYQSSFVTNSEGRLINPDVQVAENDASLSRPVESQALDPDYENNDEREEQLPLFHDEEVVDNDENDSDHWDHSPSSSELDGNEFDSDISEMDDLHFEETEAKFMLYSLMF